MPAAARRTPRGIKPLSVTFASNRRVIDLPCFSPVGMDARQAGCDAAIISTLSSDATNYDGDGLFFAARAKGIVACYELRAVRAMCDSLAVVVIDTRRWTKNVFR